MFQNEDYPTTYNIVYQKNHVEIYKFDKESDFNNPVTWLYNELRLSDDDLIKDECWVNNDEMPEEERKRAEKYLYDLGLGFSPDPRSIEEHDEYFIVTYCPSEIDPFDRKYSPRSVACGCYISGNILILQNIGLTRQGWLWEIRGGDEEDCVPRYRRTRSNSTEPMFEEFFLYMLRNYPDLKYGGVQGSDGTRELLGTWFELVPTYETDGTEEFDDISSTKGLPIAEVFALRTPYFNSILNQKKHRVDIQCNICTNLGIDTNLFVSLIQQAWGI
jgi:hypothetical protein